MSSIRTKKNSKPLLSVVIVTHQSEKTIDGCLEALEVSLKGIRYEVIVVDNCSKDRTRDRLKARPSITLITSRDNLGFSRAVNKGALRAVGEYILFLNPDVEVEHTALPLLLTYLATHVKVGIVGPQFRYPDGKLQASFGNTSMWLRELVQLSWLYKIMPWGRVIVPNSLTATLFSSEHSVAWTSGGCLLIRSALFRNLQGFDEQFFMYLEDIDLCLRAHHMGYDTVYLPAAVVVHAHRASFHGKYTYANILEAKSTIQFLSKWHGNSVMTTYLVRVLLKAKLLFKMALAWLWFERTHRASMERYFSKWREI